MWKPLNVLCREELSQREVRGKRRKARSISRERWVCAPFYCRGISVMQRGVAVLWIQTSEVLGGLLTCLPRALPHRGLC